MEARLELCFFNKKEEALLQSQRRYVGPQRVCNRGATGPLWSGPSRGQARGTRSPTYYWDQNTVDVMREEVINP